jgi:hypothetical protein
VEYAKDHKALIGEPVLKHIRRIEHLQHELTVFLAPSQRAAKARELGQHLGPCDDFPCNDSGKLGMLLPQERSKSLEVIECVLGPLDRYSSRHGLNPGVPQVSSHRTTRSFATVGLSDCVADQRRSSSSS